MGVGGMGTLLRMSLIGSYSVCLVLAMRLVLVKVLRCPRKYAYYLWLVVFLNLCIPVSVSAPVSLIPNALAETAMQVEEEVQLLPSPGESEGSWRTEELASEGLRTEASEKLEEPKAEATGESAVFGLVWLGGIVGLLLFQGISVLRLSWFLRKCPCVWEDQKDRVRELNGLPAPFLWGLWRPIIYLPAGLEHGERMYILAHEECHRKRRDQVIKGAIFLVSLVHWFNPFAWLAYGLCCRDMEISCDEAVLAGTKADIRKAYAASLLKYAAKQNGYLLTPLTFGEPSVRTRIKNVLRFRKKSVLISAAALLLILAAAAGLLLRPEIDSGNQAEEAEQETFHGQAASEELVEGNTMTVLLNQGGEFLRVGEQVYFRDGRPLYSNGEHVYYTIYDEEGQPVIYEYELDDTGFQQLLKGEILDCSEDGQLLYYLENGSLYSFDTRTAEEKLLYSPMLSSVYAHAVKEYLGRGADGEFYFACTRGDDELIYLDAVTKDGKMKQNLLGQGFPDLNSGGFYADEEYIVFASGTYEGSAGVFQGAFYSYNRKTGELREKALTDSDQFQVLGDRIYYQKYFNGEGHSQGLASAKLDLSEEMVLDQQLSLVAVKEKRNWILASREGEPYPELVRLLPDGSGEEVLLQVESLLDSDSEVYQLDWAEDWQAGDSIQYSHVNDLGNMLYVKVSQWGWREGISIGWRDACIREAWLRVSLDETGNDYPILTQPEAEGDSMSYHEIGYTVEPLEQGWKLEEITDIRLNFARMSYVPEPGTEDATYLIGQTDQYTLYGKGDFQSMLLEYSGTYAQLDYPYASNYMIPLEVWEQDFDEDGIPELAILIQVKHGTGIYIDTCLMADLTAEGKLFVYQFVAEDFTQQCMDRLSWERDQKNKGLLVKLEGKELMLQRDSEDMQFLRAEVGEQMRFSMEEGKLMLRADLAFWSDNPYQAVADYPGCYLRAQVVYEDGGKFGLTDFEGM